MSLIVNKAVKSHRKENQMSSFSIFQFIYRRHLKNTQVLNTTFKK